jgi:hypothetical protein
MENDVVPFSDPKLDPPWKELVKIASGWDYGSVHPHQEIAAILGVAYPSIDYYENVIRASTDLLVIGKRIVNIYNEGYKVLKPEEQTPEAVRDAGDIIRKLRQPISALNHVPTHILDETHKSINERAAHAISNVYVKAVSNYQEAAQIAGIHRKQKMLLTATKGKD